MLVNIEAYIRYSKLSSCFYDILVNMWLLPVSHTSLYQGICHILNLRYRLTCSSFVVVVVVEGGGGAGGCFCSVRLLLLLLHAS